MKQLYFKREKKKAVKRS